jgi:predicted GNAT family N-acyltransferase
MPQLKEEDIGKLTRFLKSNDTNKNKLTLKAISSEITEGYTSTIKKERHFTAKKDKKIIAYANTLIFNNNTSLIKNITISKLTTEKELLEMINNCTDFSKTNNCKTIELLAKKNLEPFLKKIGFEKIGEKIDSNTPHIFMKYRTTEEIQSNLRNRIDDSRVLTEISEKTSEQLRKLR